jgi:hypothetical protein
MSHPDVERDWVAGFLDDLRAAEAAAAEVLAAWITVCRLDGLRGGLRAIAEREAAHAELLAERLREMGAPCAAVLDERMRTAALARFGSERVPDEEKLASVLALPDDADATRPIATIVGSSTTTSRPGDSAPGRGRRERDGGLARVSRRPGAARLNLRARSARQPSEREEDPSRLCRDGARGGTPSLISAADGAEPAGGDRHYLGPDLVVGASDAARDAEGVVAAVDRVERRAREASEDGAQAIELAERVPRPFHEEHRQRDPRQMVGAQRVGPPGGMEGVAEEEEAADGGAARGDVRGDPPAERLAADRDPRRSERAVGRDRIEDRAIAPLEHRRGSGARRRASVYGKLNLTAM